MWFALCCSFNGMEWIGIAIFKGKFSYFQFTKWFLYSFESFHHFWIIGTSTSVNIMTVEEEKKSHQISTSSSKCSNIFHLIRFFKFVECAYNVWFENYIIIEIISNTITFSSVGFGQCIGTMIKTNYNRPIRGIWMEEWKPFSKVNCSN